VQAEAAEQAQLEAELSEAELGLLQLGAAADAVTAEEAELLAA
jgi:hypothetical protein